MLDFNNPIDFYIASHSTKAWRRKYKNYLKQVELVENDLIACNGIENIKAQVTPIINGVNSDNNDIRAENEDKFVDIIRELASMEYYHYLNSDFEHKSALYKACIFADPVKDFQEDARLQYGLERIVEGALYKIAE